MMWYILTFLAGTLVGIVLLAVVSAGREDEVYREGMEAGKRFAEENARIDRMVDADQCSRCSKDANCAYCEMMERRVER